MVRVLSGLIKGGLVGVGLGAAAFKLGITGGVLAFVSKPGFDPNLFVDGIDPQNWSELNNSPDKPMVNRALAGTYSPGSTFKPFMALAALTYGKRNRPGEADFANPSFVARGAAAPGDHGPVPNPS